MVNKTVCFPYVNMCKMLILRNGFVSFGKWMVHILLYLLVFKLFFFLTAVFYAPWKTPILCLSVHFSQKKYAITLALLKFNKILCQESELGQVSRTQRMFYTSLCNFWMHILNPVLIHWTDRVRTLVKFGKVNLI